MRKIIIVLIISFNMLFAYNQNLNLQGEYIKELKNPFAFLNKKKNSINICSQDKNIVLNATNNLKKDNLFRIYNKKEITTYTLDNKQIKNIAKIHFDDKYFVNLTKNRCDIEVNVLRGTVDLNYTDENEIAILLAINISLKIEVTTKDGSYTEDVVLDHNLGKGEDYFLTLTANDFRTLDEVKTTTNILENIINNVLLTKDKN